jgi:hypothetical protein
VKYMVIYMVLYCNGAVRILLSAVGMVGEIEGCICRVSISVLSTIIRI